MKALSLFSGGLDSSLVIKLMVREGIEVIALHFVTPLSNFDKNKEEALHKKVTELGGKLKVVYLGDDYAEIIKNPKFGYGKNLNPCIDCKILMLRYAARLMSELGASFVVTGEVIAQRPKSQHKETLKLIEKNSGLEELLLRPLSAKLLEPTLPEREKWVNREALFGFNGRSRNPQFKLAESLGIKDFAWPAGGCLLTIPSFCTRVEDLLKHNECNPQNLELLKIGRHFRLNESFKLIVGRNEKENNEILKSAANGDAIFEPLELPGPTAVGKGVFDEGIKTIASQIIASYTSQNKEAVKVTTRIFPQDNTETISAAAVDENKLKQFRV
ncbi:MAG: tRNA 4-thiouridine(8) synthase ThiI [Candidatus Omnitrophica bacterium]|nr:tRNA 4-thiouridine(8) synthase ThiI [Candidatus Omnitrophota bacterium]